MKMMILLCSLIPSLGFALSCERAERMGEFMSMNGEKFMEAYKKHKSAGNKDELRVVVDDVNQARKMAYLFPALKDMGFPSVGGKGWEPFKVTMDKSSLKGMQSGWQMKNANGDIARVRLDFDPNKGGHYNIEVFKKGPQGKEPYKLSIEFNCNGKPCTGDQIKKMAKNFN